METDRLIDRMDSVSNLPVMRSVSIGTMLNFDSDRHGHGDGDGACKQSLKNSTNGLDVFSDLSSIQ